MSRHIARELRKLRDSTAILCARLGSEDAKEKSVSPLASSSFSIIALASISYFLGWMYLYEYLHAFGIDIFSVDLPLYYILVYSFAPVSYAVKEHLWLLVGTVVLLCVGFEIISTSWRSQIVRRGALLVFLSIVTIVVVLGFRAASEAALEYANALRKSPIPTVQVVLRATARGGPLDNGLQGLSLFDASKPAAIIMETKDRYFILAQPMILNASNYRGPAEVFELDKSDVLATTRILPGRLVH